MASIFTKLPKVELELAGATVDFWANVKTYSEFGTLKDFMNVLEVMQTGDVSELPRLVWAGINRPEHGVVVSLEEVQEVFNPVSPEWQAIIGAVVLCITQNMPEKTDDETDGAKKKTATKRTK